MGQICGNTSIPRHPAHSHHSSHCHHRIRLFQVNTFKFLLAFKRLFLKWFCPEAMALSLGCYVLFHPPPTFETACLKSITVSRGVQRIFCWKTLGANLSFLSAPGKFLRAPTLFSPFYIWRRENFLQR